MKKKTASSGSIALQTRLRITLKKEIAFGPGKAELLQLVDETGSIGKAAARMKMSYMRAWTLVQTMNRSFKEPLILATHGGDGGGGAQLTKNGHTVLARYREMENACLRVTASNWRQLRQLLRD